MGEPLTDQILRRLDQVAGLYHRLVLVVAPSGGGKTEALRGVAGRTRAPLINVNLELSSRMLDLTERQRALRLPRLLGEVVEGVGGETVLLDNIEVVFDLSLRQDPLRLLQGVARNRTVVATWNGTAENGSLTYAVPDHPEYWKYPARDLVVASPEGMV